MIIIKTIIFTILVPGTVVIYIPYWLLSSANRLASPLGIIHYAGFVPIAIGPALLFWCFYDFVVTGKGTPAPIDPPKRLVMQGLYRYVRNPMYLGVATVLVGESMYFASIPLLKYSVVVFLLFHCFVIFYEEPLLRKKFGDSYLYYCKTVPRWLPKLRKQDLSE